MIDLLQLLFSLYTSAFIQLISMNRFGRNCEKRLYRYMLFSKFQKKQLTEIVAWWT